MTNENKRLLGGAAGIALVARHWAAMAWPNGNRSPPAPIGAEAPKRDAAAEDCPTASR